MNNLTYTVNVNGVMYRRVQNIHDNIIQYMKDNIERQAIVLNVEADWSTMTIDEMLLDVKCGDSLQLTMNVATIEAQLNELNEWIEQNKIT